VRSVFQIAQAFPPGSSGESQRLPYRAPLSRAGDAATGNFHIIRDGTGFKRLTENDPAVKSIELEQECHLETLGFSVNSRARGHSFSNSQKEAAMRDLRIARLRYRLAGSDPEIARAHALGKAFIGLQQLEDMIMSHWRAAVAARSRSSYPAFGSNVAKMPNEPANSGDI